MPVTDPVAWPDWVVQMDQLTADKIPFLFILDFELARPLILPLQDVENTGIRYQFPLPAISSPSEIRRVMAIPFTKHPVPFELYQLGFNQVMAAIQAGDTYLLNLSYATPLTGAFSLTHLFDRVYAPYKLYVPGHFVVFSPEQFVSIQDGVIRTFPMKGTIDATLPDAESVLLNDIKEQEEHATVVDLLRNDLSIVSGQVTVERYRYITKIQTADSSLLQCSSEIKGILLEEYQQHIGRLMHALLPAGSVTGAPKKRTVEIIRATEPEPRGYYTGVFGVFDGQSLDSAVMIRMIEERPEGFFYRSGGGITYRSQVEQEYQEMIDKVYLPQ